MKSYATHKDLTVYHMHGGLMHSVWELVNKHGYTVEIDGNNKEGFALSLRSGNVGSYAHSSPLRPFRTKADAVAACRNTFSVEPVKGLHYINN